MKKNSMKLLFSFFFLTITISLTAQNVQKQEKNDSLVSITYSSFGQVGNFNLIIDRKKITYEEVTRSNQDGEIKKTFGRNMGANEWKELVNYLSRINLDSLSKLKSPTNSRAADGAWYATLVIKTVDSIYQTEDFDEGQPMKEIWSLMFYIDTLINKRLINFEYARPK